MPEASHSHSPWPHTSPRQHPSAAARPLALAPSKRLWDARRASVPEGSAHQVCPESSGRSSSRCWPTQVTHHHWGHQEPEGDVPPTQQLLTLPSTRTQAAQEHRGPPTSSFNPTIGSSPGATPTLKPWDTPAPVCILPGKRQKENPCHCCAFLFALLAFYIY